jgi:hypothetical protein
MNLSLLCTSFKTTEQKILCRVERCGMIFSYTLQFLKTVLKLLLQFFLRILVNIQHAALFRAFVAECSDYQPSA